MGIFNLGDKKAGVTNLGDKIGGIFNLGDKIYASVPPIKEEFKFTINGDSFDIPLSGRTNANGDAAYNWIVDYGDGTVENKSGTGSTSSIGIHHDYSSSQDWQITIKPNGTATYGWLRAFGFYGNTNGANVQSNKNKMISPDSPITEMMFCISEHNAGAYYMYQTFYYCQNSRFTMGALFNLPQGITTCGLYFMYQTFYYCNGSGMKMNDIFNLPQGLTTIGTAFMWSTFQYFRPASFAVSPVFKFPQLLNQTQISGTGVFSSTFACTGTATTNNRYAIPIIGNLPAPTSSRSTFNQNFWSEGTNIPANWR